MVPAFDSIRVDGGTIAHDIADREITEIDYTQIDESKNYRVLIGCGSGIRFRKVPPGTWKRGAQTGIDANGDSIGELHHQLGVAEQVLSGKNLIGLAVEILAAKHLLELLLLVALREEPAEGPGDASNNSADRSTEQESSCRT